MKALQALALAALVLISPTARAAADFSDFAGTYKGNYNLTAGSTVLTGTLTADVSPSSNGRSMTVTIYGSTVTSGTSIASFASLKLKSNRTLNSNSGIIGFYLLSPVSGKYTGSKKKFKFTLATTVPSNLTIAYTLKFTKSQMVLKGSDPASGPLTITFSGRKKK